MLCGASRMIFIVFILGSVIAAPPDLVEEGEYLSNNDGYLNGLIPGFVKEFSLTLGDKTADIPDLFDTNNENYKLFSKYMEKGYTMKGLTFNIYNENMRNSVKALYRLLVESNIDLLALSDWAASNINTEMFTYVLHLYLLRSTIINHENIDPPFVLNPNYFVNSETIHKALDLSSNDGFFNFQEARVNQYYRNDDLITINTNYSNWYADENNCNALNYFREDIGLNSYYYGMNVLYPFWMTDEELLKINPKYTEHYYFAHQQLFARYLLEHEHLENKTDMDENCKLHYYPNLVHKNGLPFPTRRQHNSKEINDELSRIKSHEIALSECISRGFVIIGGHRVNMTNDNYIELLVKLIRANFDGPKTANMIRAAYGYGSEQYKNDEYMPAPSVLHHFETTLRDPSYWYMIQHMLNYFESFKINQLKPYNISKYITKSLKFSDANFNLTSKFEFYQFSLNNAIKKFGQKQDQLIIAARQKRMNHLPFTLNFTIESNDEKDVAFRLFLGPTCTENECWQLYARFYQLDLFKIHLNEGKNIISWSPDKSNSYSSDDLFNLQAEQKNKFESQYNLVKFPKSLIIPKGTEDGLQMTLFAMVTPIEEKIDSKTLGLNQFPNYIDHKPIGFPFHREAKLESILGHNYKFFNITIKHLRQENEKSGCYSAHLD